MAAIYSNFQQGTLTSTITNSATSISSAAFANLPVVASPDVIYLVLDPGQTAGTAEIVTVTAHTASATSVTVTRGSQSTTARSHNGGTTWSHAWTKADADLLPHRVLTTKGDLLVTSGSNVVDRLPVGTNTFALVADSTATYGVKWAAAASSVSSLTDVTLTSLSTGQYLRYNGTAWVNTTDGSTFTALNASNLGSGTVPSARVSGAYGSITGVGTLTSLAVSGTVTLSGSQPQLSLTNATSNTITFANATVAAPTFTSRSAGTRLVLWSNIGAAAAEYALGVENANMWFSVDTTSSGYKWYSGTTNTMTLTGGGILSTSNGSIPFGTTSGTGTAQPRSIIASTAAPTGGSSGDIWVRHAA